MHKSAMVDSQTIGRKIRELREAKGITAEELGEMIGVSHSTISRYEKGKTPLTIDTLSRIAEALKVPLTYFIESEELEQIPLTPNIKHIPLFDTEVSAGNGAFPEAFQPVEMIPVDRPDADYAFTVHGKSMEPEIMEGDIVIVKAMPVTEVRDGDLIVAIYDNAFFVKRIHFDGDKIILLSENDEYAPIVVDPYTRFEVLGKVVEIRRYPRRKRFRRG